MENGKVYETNGHGFDEPILEKGKNLCLFDTGDYYVIRKKNHGDVEKIAKTENALEELLKNSWTWVNYT